MTNQDIFTQILSEVTGKPKQEIDELMFIFRKMHPGGNWDNVLPDNEAEKLLNALCDEKPGIRAWIEEGALRVIAKLKAETCH